MVWLASYPKSGNTWFRMLVANLGRDTPADINDLPGRGGIASARRWFDDVMLFPSGLLTHDECDRLRPRVYAAIVAQQAEASRSPEPNPHADTVSVQDERIGDVRFVKTHDAWTCTTAGEPLLGGRDAAVAAILIVRDPRDVAASLASHNRQSIDDAIAFMARPDAGFCDRADRQPNQLRQQLPGWSGYHRSWIEQRVLPVHPIRYEDLQADAGAAFARALGFAAVPVAAETIARAAHFAGFAQLQAQERAHGFGEAPRPRPRRSPDPAARQDSRRDSASRASDGAFFRRGVAGGWRDTLSGDQARTIEAAHGDMMALFGYDCEPAS